MNLEPTPAWAQQGVSTPANCSVLQAKWCQELQSLTRQSPRAQRRPWPSPADTAQHCGHKDDDILFMLYIHNLHACVQTLPQGCGIDRQGKPGNCTFSGGYVLPEHPHEASEHSSHILMDLAAIAYAHLKGLPVALLMSKVCLHQSPAGQKLAGPAGWCLRVSVATICHRERACTPCCKSDPHLAVSWRQLKRP